MKDIMKYYLQLITLVFCLFVSACSDDDETTTPVFPDLQKIECEVGDTKTLTFEAADNWILTSSSLWCYFEQDGVTYHHIIDPKTGYPADTGTISATVICESGALSDALSTMCILLPADRALKLVKSFDADVILIDKDKNIYMTEQAGKQFTITNGDYKVK